MDFLKTRFYNEKFDKILIENNIKILNYLIEEKINFTCLIDSKRIITKPKINIEKNILLEINQTSFYNVKIENNNFLFKTYVGDGIEDFVNFNIPLKNIKKINVDEIIVSYNNLDLKEEEKNNRNNIFIFNK